MFNLEGYDRDGYPVSAGGQRLTDARYMGKDKYVQEREILK
jgi:hypothetical protein